MSRGTWIALGVVVVVMVGVVAFFILGRRQQNGDPVTAGVGGILGGIGGGVGGILGSIGGVVSGIGGAAVSVAKVPVRVANDVVSVVEKPFKFIGHLF